MGDETRAYLDAMESEVMTRMNDNQEKLLERHRATDAAVTVLTEVARATNTELASITALLTVIAGSQADLGRWAALDVDEAASRWCDLHDPARA